MKSIHRIRILLEALITSKSWGFQKWFRNHKTTIAWGSQKVASSSNFEFVTFLPNFRVNFTQPNVMDSLWLRGLGMNPCGPYRVSGDLIGNFGFFLCIKRIVLYHRPHLTHLACNRFRSTILSSMCVIGGGSSKWDNFQMRQLADEMRCSRRAQ